MALDDERERSFRQHEQVVIRLNPQGPRIINPYVVLAHAAYQGVFLRRQRP